MINTYTTLEAINTLINDYYLNKELTHTIK